MILKTILFKKTLKSKVIFTEIKYGSKKKKDYGKIRIDHLTVH